ncbi:MAG TPA: DNA translocase FtsK 4TM domain-containing protein, partial [Thermoanaerobaculia bacterium]
MSEGSFFRTRLGGEALGVLLVLAGLLAGLALLSHDAADPSLFSLSTGEAETTRNWVGGFGASLSTALFAVLGLAAWAVPPLLAYWGWRRFWQKPVDNPGSKAAGFGLLFLSVPALLSIAFGRRVVFSEEMEVGGVIGRALSEGAKSRIGVPGSVLFFATLLLLAVPLATQVSLSEVALALRVRLATWFGRITVGWVRGRDKRTKERLRRTVVAKHLEKARKEEISLSEIPFAEEDEPPLVREVPGPGKFSIRKSTAPPRRAAAAAESKPRKAEAQ